MIRKGIIGDVARLMPIFEGFGKIPEIDLGVNALSNDELNNIGNVKVTLLPESPNSKFVKQGACADCGKQEQECQCEDVDQNVSGAEIGSAGNSLVSEEPEAQMGSVGGLGKGGFGLTESADGEGSVIDDNGMKQAMKLHSENSMEKVMDMFNQFSITPSSRVKFDMDTSKPMNVVATKPIRKIPKGW